MPDNNQNQQLSFDNILQSLPISQEIRPAYEQEKNTIERISGQLNQSPMRKSTFGFSLAWLLSVKGMFGVIAALLIILPFAILAEPPEGGLDAIGYIILAFLFALGLVGFYLIYISVRTLRMFKNGYFTLGLRIKSGVFLYKDESGVTRQWTSKWYTRLLQQPCPDCNDYNLNLLAVDRNNPDRILIVDYANYRETNDEISFYIPAWFVVIWLPVKYGLSSRTFSTTFDYFLKLMAIIIGFSIFISILDYFNL